jgi:predicted cupin superfamily sugar epimerase
MTADEIKQLLQLEPLRGEGGFLRETYRSRWHVAEEYLPEGMRGSRSIGTAIYFMLTPETFSALHRMPGTEIFHFYLGDPVVMLQLARDGASQTITIGPDLAAGHRPQVVVRGHVWQGSKLVPGGKFALMGTTMAPGFDYKDFELGKRNELMAEYPGVAEMIRQYTRE